MKDFWIIVAARSEAPLSSSHILISEAVTVPMPGSAILMHRNYASVRFPHL
jgi:hypothetical protein